MYMKCNSGRCFVQGKTTNQPRMSHDTTVSVGSQVDLRRQGAWRSGCLLAVRTTLLFFQILLLPIAPVNIGDKGCICTELDSLDQICTSVPIGSWKIVVSEHDLGYVYNRAHSNLR